MPKVLLYLYRGVITLEWRLLELQRVTGYEMRLLSDRWRVLADFFFFSVIIFGCLKDGAFLAVCMLSQRVTCTVLVTVLDIAYCHQ